MENIKKNEPASAFDSETFGHEFSFEVNQPVGAMSISPCGRDVVLASRQGLHIVDLDSPYTPPWHLPHYTPWEVADVQWSPFAARDYWVVSTSNQKALVWNLNMKDARSAVEYYLHAHTRAITDINFSAHHPDVLATCAVDSYVHCWDLRTPLKPVLSFADWFAGATQVKWNRQDSNIVASSHDRTAHIWDKRKGAHPLQSIQAHDTKIYGLDWNRIRTSALVTCSLDKTIKFWDYSVDPTLPERVIQTSFPVWRARHTPFGYGMLAMPQRDDYDLYLYDRRTDVAEQDASIPVKTFPGHQGQVKEFVWRFRGNIDSDGVDHREFQLVTWSADQTLRLHRMDENVLAGVGYVKDHQSHERLHLTRRDARYKTFRRPTNNLELQSVRSSSNLHEQYSTTSSFNVANPGMALHSRLTGVSAGFLNTKVNTTSKAADGADLNPINWMKGVKAGKKEIQQDKGIEADGAVDHRLHRDSEEFESLGEEITHVGTKFGKVAFDTVNINQRYIQLTMRGVWEKDSPIYLECRIDFPSDYPLLHTPVLDIKETALLDTEKIKTIKQDVQKISDAYLRLRRSSLEAIVRYLHGDQSLEDALKWTAEDLDTTMPIIRPEEESSSDEDDLGKAVEDHDSEFGLVDSGLFVPLNAHANMPLAKGCAGVWCENGTLVCFFPPKAKPTSLVGSLASHRHDGLPGSKKSILRNPFSGSRHNKSKARSTSSWEDRESASETDFSESGYSSSASSTSSQDPDDKDVLRIAQHVFDMDHFELSKYGSERVPDATLQSVDSLTGSNLNGSPPKSILSFYDLRDLLPAKEELAAEYVCSGPEACQVNAAVAMKHGYTSIAEVWMVLDLILHDKFLALPKAMSILLKPKTSVLQTSAMPSGTGGLNDRDKKIFHQDDLVRWSSHPFGGRLVIKNLFEYYAGLADIQMLAIMSCILSERDRKLDSLTLTEEHGHPRYRHSKNGRRFYDSQTFPIFRSVTNMKLGGDVNTSASSIKNHTTSGNDSALLSSSYETVVHDNSSKGSRTLDTMLNRSFGRQNSASKFSASPEWIRPLQKSSTNLANAIMALPLPFSLTTSAAASPPTTLSSRKKPSPIGSLSIASGWKAGSFSATGTTFAHSNSTKDSDNRVRVDSGVADVKATNRMTFKRKSQDNRRHGHRGITSEPLLDPTMNPLYEGWRNEYAEHLLGWGLLIPYAEVRRINGLSFGYAAEVTHVHEQTSTTDSETTTKYAADPPKVVAPVVHCRFCGNGSESKSQAEVCQNCYSSDVTICVLCNLPVHGRSSPCLVCGHVLHISCRKTWEHHDVGTPCPTGCGCICSAPTIPPEGVVQISAVNTSQPTTPQLPRFIVPIPFPSGRSASEAASAIQGFNHNSMQNQAINLYPSAGNASYSTLPVKGSRTPRSTNANSQSSQDVAYTALQNIAAQTRPRGDLTASGKSTRLRSSKSLLFTNSFGNGNSSTTNLNESKVNRPYRLGNSLLAGTGNSNRSSISAASSSRGKSRRSSAATSIANNASNIASGGPGFAASNTTGRKQPNSARQHDRRAFDLDYTQTDDSDVDGV